MQTNDSFYPPISELNEKFSYFSKGKGDTVRLTFLRELSTKYIFQGAKKRQIGIQIILVKSYTIIYYILYTTVYNKYSRYIKHANGMGAESSAEQ